MITNNNHYLTKSLLLISIIILVLIFINLNFTNKNNLRPSIKMQLNTINNSNNKSQVKTILYWNKAFSRADFGYGFGSEIFENCEVQSCFTTNDKSLLSIHEYDAILFHSATFSVKDNGLPQIRSPHQKYVFYSLESYFNTYIEPKCNENFYNWTMTFKRDSDVFQPYGTLVKNNTGYQLPTNEDLKSRKKKVAWFASNCYTPGAKRRLSYVNELQKYIPVDIYGSCGKLKCARSEKCYKMLEQNYKFYISFENSFCEDYVTEKVYNVLKYNIVPIVFGFVDYDTLFPKNSLVNAFKFINPKHLANFLWDLDANDTEYMKYFEWKKFYTVKNDFNLCNLCKKLHEPLNYSSYTNVKDWYYGYQCVS